MRRLLENGANTSFVNRIADAAIPVENVVADPVAIAAANESAANPKIALPYAIYPDRLNSSGIVWADEGASKPLLAALQPLLARTDWAAAPLVAGRELAGAMREARDPSSGRAIGRVADGDREAARAAMQAAHAARMRRRPRSAPRRSSAPPT